MGGVVPMKGVCIFAAVLELVSANYSENISKP